MPRKSKAKLASYSVTSRKEQDTRIPAPGDIVGAKTLALPFELQQQLLDAFKIAFPIRLGQDLDQLPEIIQTVKGHLYNREFSQAFGQDRFLEAYAVRWSPSRALGYAQLFSEIFNTFGTSDGNGTSVTDLQDLVLDDTNDLRVTCIGGGAGAEIASLASTLSVLREGNSEVDASQPRKTKIHTMSIDLVDMAEWANVNQQLHKALTSPPPISPYASPAAITSTNALVEATTFITNFHRKDVLALAVEEISELVKSSRLVTVLFVLNELYTATLSRTQTLLLNLTNAMKEESLFLVVDSPGSFSEVVLNGKERRYPMQWLLDHTLLTIAPTLGTTGPNTTTSKDSNNFDVQDPAPRWEKLLSEESRWFRLDPKLRYPLQLEDMRCQIHLYRKIR